jgi:hypothetical protein
VRPDETQGGDGRHLLLSSISSPPSRPCSSFLSLERYSFVFCSHVEGPSFSLELFSLSASRSYFPPHESKRRKNTVREKGKKKESEEGNPGLTSRLEYFDGRGGQGRTRTRRRRGDRGEEEMPAVSPLRLVGSHFKAEGRTLHMRAKDERIPFERKGKKRKAKRETQEEQGQGRAEKGRMARERRRVLVDPVRPRRRHFW